ncbi:MAG TPA: tRNA (cytidine(34)-2'-O)-methyltransferase [Candidatus Sulfotelmatobacter sp.]|nr:tRNA (cytidine(34)-2'-O)-methyltransferase [Candidatus Sulfotelmatobacter sp.]
MRIALYQPDIPQNAGSLLRLGACLGLPVDIIEPCGFLLDDRKLKRAGMDYLDLAEMTRHSSWQAFQAARTGRLVLLTTKGEQSHLDFTFRPDDVLMLGRESCGVPDDVHQSADARIRIPMTPQARSINLAMAASLVVGEALRQTGGFPG